MIYIQSYGYKYGHPNMGGLVIDVTFLPNPESNLLPLPGSDDRVMGNILQGNHDFIDSLAAFVKAYPIKKVAIGCRHGRHRSVAVATALDKKLRLEGRLVKLRHRDVHRTGVLQEFSEARVVQTHDTPRMLKVKGSETS